MDFISNPILDKKISIPGSKSISNRAILLASLADGESILENILIAEDTQLMLEACQKLGARIKNIDNTFYIEGLAGKLDAPSHEIYVGNAGTLARFILPVLSFAKAPYRLISSQAMQERPIDDLLLALSKIGVRFSKEISDKSFPIRTHEALWKHNFIEVSGKKSSQFVSAMAMAAALSNKEIQIQIQNNNLVSRAYLNMTLELMRTFSVHSELTASGKVIIPAQQHYKACHYHVEADASTASYFMILVAIHGGSLSICGLKKESLQSDLGLLGILEKMGCQVYWQKNSVRLLSSGELKAVECNMNEMTDVLPSLVIAALFAKGSSRFYNIAHMRYKECDRIKALADAFKLIGAHAVFSSEQIIIHSNLQNTLHPATIKTFEDHRIAMSFAILATKIKGITLDNKECVAKTFPSFFLELEKTLKA